MGVRLEGTEKYILDISCIVLAGGKGLRLGRDKVQEIVGNSNLLQRVLSQLAPFNRDIIIVTASEKSLPQFTGYQRFRIVTDTYPGKGALGGIYTGLAISNSRYNLVVACDMPFLNRALLRYMIELSAGFDLVVPRLGELVEPLHAVYAKSCLAPIERMLGQGNLEVRALFELVNVRYVEAEEIDKFDPKHLSFFNINTEADLEKAQQLAMGDMSHDDC
jgi:molybdopterin-guanine dinucleotide biosynthesis protein A